MLYLPSHRVFSARFVFCCCHNFERSAAIRDRLRINNRIRAREVRLIDENGAQVGIVSIRDALSMKIHRQTAPFPECDLFSRVSGKALSQVGVEERSICFR